MAHQKPEMIECAICKGFGGYFWYLVPNFGGVGERAASNTADKEPKPDQIWTDCGECDGAGFVQKYS